MHAPLFFGAIAVGIGGFVASEYWSSCLDPDGSEVELALGKARKFGCEGGTVRFVEAMSGPVIDVSCSGRTTRLFLMNSEQFACGAGFQSLKMWNGGTTETMNVRLLILPEE